MAQDRPDIPAALKRSVLVEAGHRCAIPVCRQTPVELAHITPWSKVKEHAFDNLIALCPTCHTRYDRGDIDRKSMLHYKMNLEVLNHRYTDIERQLLKAFIRRWQMVNESQERHGFPPLAICDSMPPGSGQVRIHSQMEWMLLNLLDDEIIEFRQEGNKVMELQEQELNTKVVLLTKKGREFLARWIDADALSQ